MSDPTTAETPTMHHEAYMDHRKTFCRRCGAVEGTDAWAGGVCAGWNPEDNPASTETPTMRERLGDILSNRMNEYRRASTSFEEREIIAEARTAILREMLEPSEAVDVAMLDTGNAEGLVMHTKEFMDNSAVEAGFEPYSDDSEARKCVRLAMHWGWRRGVESILNETQD